MTVKQILTWVFRRKKNKNKKGTGKTHSFLPKNSHLLLNPWLKRSLSKKCTKRLKKVCRLIRPSLYIYSNLRLHSFKATTSKTRCQGSCEGHSERRKRVRWFLWPLLLCWLVETVRQVAYSRGWHQSDRHNLASSCVKRGRANTIHLCTFEGRIRTCQLYKTAHKLCHGLSQNEAKTKTQPGRQRDRGR